MSDVIGVGWVICGVVVDLDMIRYVVGLEEVFWGFFVGVIKIFYGRDFVLKWDGEFVF